MPSTRERLEAAKKRTDAQRKLKQDADAILTALGINPGEAKEFPGLTEAMQAERRLRAQYIKELQSR